MTFIICFLGSFIGSFITSYFWIAWNEKQKEKNENKD